MPSQKHWTPESVLSVVRSLEECISDLGAMSRGIGMPRRFTLDGRLVGDIGELLVAAHYQIELCGTQKAGYDGFRLDKGEAKERYPVEIKCRRASTNMTFPKAPAHLIVVKMSEDWTTWTVLFNGDGRIVEELTRKKLREREQRGARDMKSAFEIELKDFSCHEFKAGFENDPVPLRRRPMSLSPPREGK